MESSYYMIKYNVNNDGTITEKLYAKKDEDKIVDVLSDPLDGVETMESRITLTDQDIQKVNTVFQDLEQDIVYLIILANGSYDIPTPDVASLVFDKIIVTPPPSIKNLTRIQVSYPTGALGKKGDENDQLVSFVTQLVTKTEGLLFGDELKKLCESQFKGYGTLRMSTYVYHQGFVNYLLLDKTFYITEEDPLSYTNIFLLTKNGREPTPILKDKRYPQGMLSRTTVSTNELLNFVETLGYRNVVLFDFSCNSCLRVNSQSNPEKRSFREFADRFNKEAFVSGYRY